MSNCAGTMIFRALLRACSTGLWEAMYGQFRMIAMLQSSRASRGKCWTEEARGHLLEGLQVVDQVVQAVQALLHSEVQLVVLGAKEACHLHKVDSAG